MSDTQNLQTEPHGSKKALKKQLDRELRSTITDYTTAWVEQHARNLAYDPPIFRRGTSIPETLGWFYPLGEVGDRIYMQILTSAQSEAEWLMHDHQLASRPDAGAWQRWLSKRAAFWAVQCARVALIEIVRHMERLLEERYGVSFEHSYAHNAVAFYLADGPALGGKWEVLSDAVVRGDRPEDYDYLRVVYAYHLTRKILLRIHHTRIYLPWGRQAVRWVIAQVWWDVWRTQAENIVAAQ